MGMHLPDREVTNLELEAMKELETTDEWIQQRTGIQKRYYVVEGQSGTDLAVPAAEAAIEAAGLTPDDIDFIIYATLSPDYFFPGNGCFLQERLFGDRPIGALDVRNQCSGFIYSLVTADMMIKTVSTTTFWWSGLKCTPQAWTSPSGAGRHGPVRGRRRGRVVGPAPEGHPGILNSALYAEGKYAGNCGPSSRPALIPPG